MCSLLRRLGIYYRSVSTGLDGSVDNKYCNNVSGINYAISSFFFFSYIFNSLAID